MAKCRVDAFPSFALVSLLTRPASLPRVRVPWPTPAVIGRHARDRRAGETRKTRPGANQPDGPSGDDGGHPNASNGREEKSERSKAAGQPASYEARTYVSYVHAPHYRHTQARIARGRGDRGFSPVTVM